jgi:protein gp37
VAYPQPKGPARFNETNDNISWARFTWNPVTGCLHGCKYCYARELATRPSYAQKYPVGFTPLFHHERLDGPRNTQVPEQAKTDPRYGRVFVCSMADLYGKWVPNEWIEQVHKSCIDNPKWEYLMLTKFPRRYVGLDLPKTAWLGTSVDEQKRVRLAEEAFREIKDVRVKWLSLEPLLAELKFSDLSMFDWVVIGAQSATEQPDGTVAAFAPPIEWVTRLTDQAHEAGCGVYQKENLIGKPDQQSPGMKLIQEEPRRRGGAPLRPKGDRRRRGRTARRRPGHSGMFAAAEGAMSRERLPDRGCRDSQGRACGPLGVALDLLLGNES